MADDVLERLARVGQGDRDGARRQLLQLWGEVGADEVHRCAVAHALADLQDDVNDELRWDLVALEAAAGIRSDRLATTGAAGPPAALYPSLHLNVADCYRRLGQLPQARAHVAEGLRHVSALVDDGYGRMVHAALRRLDDRLQADRAAAEPKAVEQVVQVRCAARGAVHRPGQEDAAAGADRRRVADLRPRPSNDERGFEPPAGTTTAG